MNTMTQIKLNNKIFSDVANILPATGEFVWNICSLNMSGWWEWRGWPGWWCRWWDLDQCWWSRSKMMLTRAEARYIVSQDWCTHNYTWQQRITWRHDTWCSESPEHRYTCTCRCPPQRDLDTREDDIDSHSLDPPQPGPSPCHKHCRCIGPQHSRS